MCGITGVIGPLAGRVIARMTREIEHRGPDGHGLYAPDDQPVALGHRRLAIIDLSPAGAQPMSDPSGRYWITFNGEIYNYVALRSELESDWTFRSHSDTEVLIAAYRRWGAACLDRLNGMFAFALWDREQRTLFAARDRLGIKPFHWTESNGHLLFASEVKALLASGLVEVAPDPQVTHNPWHYPSAPRTGFRNVHKLPAGHVLTWRAGRSEIRRWWEPAVRDFAGRPEKELEEELAGLLEEAVELQMVSDVPVGAFLSGGLDSSLIVALMTKRSQRPVSTFTIKFRDVDKRFEAMPQDDVYAEQVARQLGCHHRAIEIEPNVLDLLPKMIWHIDEPIVDPAAINAYLISVQARESGIVVLQTGMGADEIFGGYRRQYACLLAEKYQRAVPRLFQAGIKSIVDVLPVAGSRRGFRTVRWSKRFLSFASLDPIDRFLQSDESIAPARYSALFEDSALLPYDSLDEVRHRREVLLGSPGTYLQRMCRTDAAIFLPDHNLSYFDKATMAAGIEARPPLIDHRIVEFALNLPDASKIGSGVQKKLLRSTASRWLPRNVVKRPKAPFGSPLRAWVRNDLRELVDDVLSERSLREAGIYRPAFVRACIDQDRRGVADHAALIFNLLWRELWLRGIPRFAMAAVNGE